MVQAAGASPLVGYTNALLLTGALLVLGGVWTLLGVNPEATRAKFAARAADDARFAVHPA